MLSIPGDQCLEEFGYGESQDSNESALDWGVNLSRVVLENSDYIIGIRRNIE